MNNTGKTILYIILAMFPPVGWVILAIILISEHNKRGLELFNPTGFDQQLLQLGQLLQQIQQANGRSGPGMNPQSFEMMKSRFASQWTQANANLQHMDRMRAEAAEMRLADVKTQAASMGLFLD